MHFEFLHLKKFCWQSILPQVGGSSDPSSQSLVPSQCHGSGMQMPEVLQRKCWSLHCPGARVGQPCSSLRSSQSGIPSHL